MAKLAPPPSSTTVFDHVLRGPHRRAAAHAIRASHLDKYHPHCSAVALADVLFKRLVEAVSPDASEDACHVDVLTEEWWPDVHVLVETGTAELQDIKSTMTAHNQGADDGRDDGRVPVPSQSQRQETSETAFTMERARRIQLEIDRSLVIFHATTLIKEMRSLVRSHVPLGLDRHKELMSLARKVEADVGLMTSKD